MRIWIFTVLSLVLCINSAYSKTTIMMFQTTKTGHGGAIGSIDLEDTPHGLLITPHLYSVNAGPHGFHVHENPSCHNNGLAAGGHWDPRRAGQHLGPYRPGHLGDLPVLVAYDNHRITTPVLAPRLKVKDLNHHALILHAGGDNYLDVPKKLGGGGARIACGETVWK